MCRNKELGGRRCPQHTDPIKHAAYNKRRRELYAAKKTSMVESKKLTSNFLHLFPDMNSPRPVLEGEKLKELLTDAVSFATKIIPEYEAKEAEDRLWSAKHENYTKNLEMNESLMFYTGGHFGAVRDYLNGRQVDETHDTSLFLEGREDWYAQNIKTMDKALSMVDEPVEPRLVYRGMKINKNFTSAEVDNFIETQFPVGGVISQKSYMSTSASAYVASSNFSESFTIHNESMPEKAVVFEILTKKGAPLTYGTSAFDIDEKEVLMPRETRFKVVSVDREVSFSTGVPSKYARPTGKVVSNLRTVIRLVDADDENEEN